MDKIESLTSLSSIKGHTEATLTPIATEAKKLLPVLVDVKDTNSILELYEKIHLVRVSLQESSAIGGSAKQYEIVDQVINEVRQGMRTLGMTTPGSERSEDTLTEDDEEHSGHGDSNSGDGEGGQDNSMLRAEDDLLVIAQSKKSLTWNPTVRFWILQLCLIGTVILASTALIVSVDKDITEFLSRESSTHAKKCLGIVIKAVDVINEHDAGEGKVKRILNLLQEISPPSNGLNSDTTIPGGTDPSRSAFTRKNIPLYEFLGAIFTRDAVNGRATAQVNTTLRYNGICMRPRVVSVSPLMDSPLAKKTPSPFRELRPNVCKANVGRKSVWESSVPGFISVLPAARGYRGNLVTTSTIIDPATGVGISFQQDLEPLQDIVRQTSTRWGVISPLREGEQSQGWWTWAVARSTALALAICLLLNLLISHVMLPLCANSRGLVFAYGAVVALISTMTLVAVGISAWNAQEKYQVSEMGQFSNIRHSIFLSIASSTSLGYLNGGVEAFIDRVTNDPENVIKNGEISVRVGLAPGDAVSHLKVTVDDKSKATILVIGGFRNGVIDESSPYRLPHTATYYREVQKDGMYLKPIGGSSRQVAPVIVFLGFVLPLLFTVLFVQFSGDQSGWEYASSSHFILYVPIHHYATAMYFCVALVLSCCGIGIVYEAAGEMKLIRMEETGRFTAVLAQAAAGLATTGPSGLRTVISSQNGLASYIDLLSFNTDERTDGFPSIAEGTELRFPEPHDPVGNSRWEDSSIVAAIASTGVSNVIHPITPYFAPTVDVTVNSSDARVDIEALIATAPISSTKSIAVQRLLVSSAIEPSPFRVRSYVAVLTMIFCAMAVFFCVSEVAVHDAATKMQRVMEEVRYEEEEDDEEDEQDDEEELEARRGERQRRVQKSTVTQQLIILVVALCIPVVSIGCIAPLLQNEAAVYQEHAQYEEVSWLGSAALAPLVREAGLLEAELKEAGSDSTTIRQTIMTKISHEINSMNRRLFATSPVKTYIGIAQYNEATGLYESIPMTNYSFAFRKNDALTGAESIVVSVERIEGLEGDFQAVAQLLYAISYQHALVIFVDSAEVEDALRSSYAEIRETVGIVFVIGFLAVTYIILLYFDAAVNVSRFEHVSRAEILPVLAVTAASRGMEPPVMPKSQRELQIVCFLPITIIIGAFVVTCVMIISGEVDSRLQTGVTAENPIMKLQEHHSKFMRNVGDFGVTRFPTIVAKLRLLIADIGSLEFASARNREEYIRLTTSTADTLATIIQNTPSTIFNLRLQYLAKVGMKMHHEYVMQKYKDYALGMDLNHEMRRMLTEYILAIDEGNNVDLSDYAAHVDFSKKMFETLDILSMVQQLESMMMSGMIPVQDIVEPQFRDAGTFSNITSIRLSTIAAGMALVTKANNLTLAMLEDDVPELFSGTSLLVMQSMLTKLRQKIKKLLMATYIPAATPTGGPSFNYDSLLHQKEDDVSTILATFASTQRNQIIEWAERGTGVLLTSELNQRDIVTKTFKEVSAAMSSIIRSEEYANKRVQLASFSNQGIISAQGVEHLTKRLQFEVEVRAVHSSGQLTTVFASAAVMLVTIVCVATVVALGKAIEFLQLTTVNYGGNNDAHNRDDEDEEDDSTGSDEVALVKHQAKKYHMRNARKSTLYTAAIVLLAFLPLTCQYWVGSTISSHMIDAAHDSAPFLYREQRFIEVAKLPPKILGAASASFLLAGQNDEDLFAIQMLKQQGKLLEVFHSLGYQHLIHPERYGENVFNFQQEVANATNAAIVRLVRDKRHVEEALFQSLLTYEAGEKQRVDSFMNTSSATSIAAVADLLTSKIVSDWLLKKFQPYQFRARGLRVLEFVEEELPANSLETVNSETVDMSAIDSIVDAVRTVLNPLSQFRASTAAKTTLDALSSTVSDADTLGHFLHVVSDNSYLSLAERDFSFLLSIGSSNNKTVIPIIAESLRSAFSNVDNSTKPDLRARFGTILDLTPEDYSYYYANPLENIPGSTENGTVVSASYQSFGLGFLARSVAVHHEIDRSTTEPQFRRTFSLNRGLKKTTVTVIDNILSTELELNTLDMNELQSVVIKGVSSLVESARAGSPLKKAPVGSMGELRYVVVDDEEWSVTASRYGMFAAQWCGIVSLWIVSVAMFLFAKRNRLLRGMIG